MPTKAPIPVPYDFDYSGTINTPYATPNESLPIKTVRKRMFKGYCRPAGIYEKTLPVFLDKKDTIYRLYRDFRLIDRTTTEATLKYYDSFYEILDEPQKVIKTFYFGCELNHRYLHRE